LSLKERLEHDLKQAMKAREEGKTRLSVIRMVRAAVKNLEIDRRHPLSEEEMIEVLAREVKQRREVMPDYERSGRQDLVDQLTAEIRILEEYLPKALNEQELLVLIEEAVSATHATGPKDMGKVMGYLMPKVRGRADGQVLSRMVKERLG